MIKGRIRTMMMLVTLGVTIFSGCGKIGASKGIDGDNDVTIIEESEPAKGDAVETKPSIVCTTFPQYDWVMNILGDKSEEFDVTILMDKGVDLHSFQPTAQDIANISKCDMFIYVGGESDSWVEDALKEATNENMQVLNLVGELGEMVKEEEIVEGMEHNHEHEEEELTEDMIQNRTLSEFKGEWVSLHPMLIEGKLGEFCEYKANTDDDELTTKETVYEKYNTAWACDADKLAIDEKTITYTYTDGREVSADYEYAGYSIKYAEDGSISNVRYQFETKNEDAPKYVQFNDHAHEPSEVAHFHIYFGNEGFDELTNATTNPYFVHSGLSDEEILKGLMGHSHEHENDEHVWLSLNNTKVLVNKISETMQKVDSENADVYSENAKRYIKEIEELDAKYQEMIDNAGVKTVVFGDRFPFRYLVDDYGLGYYAAFAGCSAESEASFETIVFLAQKVDEYGLDTVFVIENSDKKIAQTIIDNTKEKNQEIMMLDSMQSVTMKDIENGASYLEIMQKNYDTLLQALN